MSDPLVIQEAASVFATFRLLVDRPAFTPAEANKIREQRAALGKSISGLVRESKSPLLREDAQKFSAVRRKIVSEAIRYERLTILEAATGMSVGQMVQQVHGMVEALKPVLGVSEGLASVVGDKAQRAESMAMELEDLEGSGLQKEFAKKMDEFKKVFADLGVVVKGLVSVSDELSSGSLGEILQPVLSWVVKRKQKQTSLLDTLSMYDQEVNKVSSQEKLPVKQGYLSKLFTSKGPQPGATNTAEKFKKALEEVVKSKAPGFAKVANSFGADIMEKPIRQVFAAFHAFDEAVASHVDLDFLMNMTKQSFGSALKGLVGGFFSGRGGMSAGIGGR